MPLQAAWILAYRGMVLKMCNLKLYFGNTFGGVARFKDA